MEDGGCLSVLLSTVASPSEEDFDLQFSLWPTCSTSASASASSSSAPTPSPSSSLDDSDSLCSIDSSDRGVDIYQIYPTTIITNSAFDVCFPNFDFTCGTSDSDLYSSIFNDQNEQLDARDYYQTQNERVTEGKQMREIKDNKLSELMPATIHAYSYQSYRLFSFLKRLWNFIYMITLRNMKW